jgi:hypothetical protein
LDLFLQFTAVKNLYIFKEFLPHIVLALQDLTRKDTTEVLPALQNVFLERSYLLEPIEEGIVKFISAQQLTNEPIAISVWYNYSTRHGMSHICTMIDNCPSSISLTFCVALLFFSFVFAL